MIPGSSRVKITVIAVFLLLFCACLPAHATDTSYRFVTKWGTMGTGDGQLNNPTAIDIDASGHIYVTDSGNNRVQKFTSDGQFVTTWGLEGSGNGQFNRPVGLAVDSLDNVYVADEYNNRIQKFSSTGQYITQWGKMGPENGQFYFPAAVAVDSANNVYVTEVYNFSNGGHRVQKFTSSGQFITKWEILTPGNVNPNLDGICMDNQGNILVSEFSNHYVEKFSPSGQLISRLGDTGQIPPDLYGPTGCDVDRTGNIFVAQAGNVGYQFVKKLSPDGKIITTIGGGIGNIGNADGEYQGPFDVVLDSRGNVYVIDSGNHRIQKFEPVIPTTLVPATLTVTSTPAGADVFIDAVQRGTTPATFTDITPGTHSVTVSKIGYLGSYSTITVSPQQPSTVDVALEPLKVGTGIISVRSDPPGASIVLDGQYTGKTTPYDFYEVTPGVHTLEITMLEYGTYPKTITVDPGTTVVVTTPWTYTEKDTVVFFSSDPDGANVYIDDIMKGVTPLSLHLKKGAYIVKMTKEDYKDNESALYVSSADPIHVTKILETPGFGSILAVVALVAVVLVARKVRS